MRNLFLFITLFVCWLEGAGQVSISDFIASAQNDPDVRVLEQQGRYLQDRPYTLSPVQRVEFRTQNRELIPHQQEFALRLTPSNPWEVKNNNRYFGSVRSVLGLEREMALKEELVSRYQLVIYYAYYSELLQHLRERQKLMSDQISILQRQSGSSFFDADDFVDLQLDQMDRMVEYDEASFEMLSFFHDAERLYGKPLGDSLSWTMSDLIDLVSIRKVADSLNAREARSLNIEYQRSRIEMAQNEYLLDKSNINAGFLQGEFDNRRREQDRTPFNISLGITIPIVNPNKNDMARRQLDVIEYEHDLEESTSEQVSHRRLTQDKLGRLLARYNVLAGRIGEYEDPQIPQSLSLLQRGDPRVIVSFRQNLIKLRILLSKVRRDILLAYVEQIAGSDHIQQKPLVNFLSKGLEKIE